MGAVPESLRLFALCDAMNWSVLPVAGGLYDQHPDFIDQIQVIFQAKADAERRKQAQAEMKAKSGRKTK